jgi:hypothetical protein
MAGHQVIDKRRHDFFMCDNAIIDTYAQTLGPYALSVYVALLRYAGQKDTCFPSLKTLGEQLGMGKNSVVKAIAALKKANLISVKHRREKAGDAASNLYYIRQVVCDTNHPVPETNNGGLPDKPRVVCHVNTKNTQVKHTHQEEEAGRDRDEAQDAPTVAEVHALVDAFMGAHQIPPSVRDLEARKALLRQQAAQLAARA